jgi:DNA-directed RNA polymerase specialized sigma24 family protein
MQFPETEWTLLAQATLNGETSAGKALAEFCRRYRAPVLGFIIGRGIPHAEAEDLAHDFMVHLMEKSTLRRADAARGRFRSFLIGALKRFLRDVHLHRARLKNGGGESRLSLDAPEMVAAPPALLPEDDRTFDREWALRLLHLTLDSISSEYQSEGQSEAYDVLRSYLPGSVAPPPYEVSACRLGLTLSAFKTEVHRLRKRFRERLQREVAATLSAPQEIDAEFSYLGRVLLADSK